MVADREFRRDRVRMFELHLQAESVLRLNDHEVVAARFVEPQALLAEGILPPFVRAHLGKESPCGPPGTLRAGTG